MVRQIRKENVLEFRQYQHIVQLDDPLVDGLLVGTCYMFPKLDGSNASVWMDRFSCLRFGTRRRMVTAENDNQGFAKEMLNISKPSNMYSKLRHFFAKHPNWRLYGEWLVPHTLKTYEDNAWRKFYIFDVVREDGTYVPYWEYAPELEWSQLDYVPPIKIIQNPFTDDLIFQLERNTFLIKNGQGIGEGIVIKNYDYTNYKGEIRWAKIVNNEFKAKHTKAMGAPEQRMNPIEKDLVDNFMSKSTVDKIFWNIMGEYLVDNLDDHSQQFPKAMIPRLLETSFHDLIAEESWKMYKYAIKEKQWNINLKVLRQFALNKVKEFYPQLFRRQEDETQS